MKVGDKVKLSPDGILTGTIVEINYNVGAAYRVCFHQIQLSPWYYKDELVSIIEPFDIFCELLLK